MDLKMTFKMLELKTLLSLRGMDKQGKVQKYIDSEMLRLTDPYVPKLTGTLVGSGTDFTNIGSGEIKYNTPYARRQYFENKGNGLRGKMWFERSKADNKLTILKGATDIARKRT